MNRQALKIASVFSVIGILWIFTSDYASSYFIKNPELYKSVQTYKGWFFVLSTAVIIYFVANNLFQKIHERNVSLARSLLRYRSTLDNMLEGAQIIDYNWKYIYVNDVVAKQGKKDRSELLRKTMMEVYPGIENTELFQHLKKCMEQRQSHRMLNEFVFPDGSKGWFELSIQPVPEGVFILSYDITDRIKSEKELKKGEKRLIEAQRMAKMGDFTWNVESGEVTWSDALYDLLGHDRNEKLDFETINENIHHPVDREEVIHWFDRMIKSGTDKLDPKEYRILKKDGEVMYVRTQGKISRKNGITKIIATVQDVTEQKQAQQKIEESQRKLQTLIGNLPGMAYRGRTEESLPMDFVSDGCTELTGYTANELIGTDLYNNITYPDDREYVWNTIQNAVRKARHFVMEYRIKKKDGSIHWVWEQGVAVSVNHDQVHIIEGFITDINDRKIAENELIKHRENLELLVKQRTMELYKSEEKYRGLYESVKDGIVHVNMDGRIIECNPEYSKMLGYTRDELQEKTYKDLTPKKWHRIEDELLEKETLERGYTDEYEKEYIRKDGSIFPISIRVWLIRDEDGKPEAMWGIVRDISKRKEYEQSILGLNRDLENRQKELENANKELEAFAYSVSHDLRAPLRAITGFTQILMEDYIDDLDDEAKRLGTVIQKNSNDMSELIDDLLAFSRLGRASLQFSRVDMTNMADSIFYEATHPEIRKKIEFKVSKMPTIQADSKMMRQVWMNLISNAVKYSSVRDQIIINIFAQQKNEHIIYSITDNGVGFDMKYKDKLFGVFQRLHKSNEFEGTGVGLALVQRIVHRHGGQVWAESEIDKGSTFYFSLPVRQL